MDDAIKEITNNGVKLTNKQTKRIIKICEKGFRLLMDENFTELIHLNEEFKYDNNEELDRFKNILWDYSEIIKGNIEKFLGQDLEMDPAALISYLCIRAVDEMGDWSIYKTQA